jgi:hypothetical protein
MHKIKSKNVSIKPNNGMGFGSDFGVIVSVWLFWLEEIKSQISYYHHFSGSGLGLGWTWTQLRLEEKCHCCYYYSQSQPQQCGQMSKEER